MAQIFVSHSAKDKTLVDFISKVAAQTKARIILEEYENLSGARVNADKIKKDIGASNAIFVLLGPGANNLKHTRDWVNWETGVAHAKDVWVIEHVATLGKINVVIPALRHYVLIGDHPSFFPYFKQIIEGYDDSEVVGGAAIFGALGAAAGGPVGAMIGGFIGGAIGSKRDKLPRGSQIKCIHCCSTYGIHVPDKLPQIRCPVCNENLALNWEGA